MLINTFFTPIQVTQHTHPLLNIELVKLAYKLKENPKNKIPTFFNEKLLIK